MRQTSGRFVHASPNVVPAPVLLFLNMRNAYTWSLLLVGALALWSLTGCSETIEPHYLTEPQPFRAEVLYWGDAERATSLLHVVGFELVQASDPAHAQVIVYGEGPLCDGHREAYWTACGGVWLCQAVSDTVLAHEIGHTLGVQHVPEAEGPAIMNPHADVAEQMTELDAEAFVHRVLKDSIFDKGCER